MKKITNSIVLLSLTILIISSLIIMNQSEVTLATGIVIDNNATGIIIDNSSPIFNETNMAPGDIISSSVTVKNQGESKFDFFVRTEGPDSNNLLYNNIKIKVIYKGKEMYEGIFKGLENQVFIGSIPVNGEEDVTFEVLFPEDLGNDFQGARLDNLKFVFSAESEEADSISKRRSRRTKTGEEEIIFEDILDHWARKDIEYMARLGIVRGLGERIFGPDLEITRAQFATMLVRAIDIEVESGEASFIDVSEDDWFADSVFTAYKAGLVKGFSQEEFRPNDKITREQLAIMVVRSYENKTGEELPFGGLEFADRAETSPWALDAVKKAYSAGITKGMTESEFDPKGNSTRAQAAVMLRRLQKLIN